MPCEQLKGLLTRPSPPALLTAAASSAYPTQCMPPCTTGTRVVSLPLYSRICLKRLTFNPQCFCERGIERHYAVFEFVQKYKMYGTFLLDTGIATSQREGEDICSRVFM